MKTRFVLIGSGWRAMYYARIAKALPNRFACLGILCRSQEKKERMEQEGIHAVMTREECLALKPDFAVIAVDKPHMSETAMEWSEYLPVLMETPAATDFETLAKMRELLSSDRKIAVAEQYRLYATHSARMRVLSEVMPYGGDYLYLSEAHEYHGASLMRQYIGGMDIMPFQVSAKSWEFLTAETLSRYERFTDGRMEMKKRTLAVFEFSDFSTCVYDFDSEQYRSPIRHNLFKLQGVRGEMIDNTVRWLDQNNRPRCETMQVKTRLVKTDNPNPNFSEFREITGITFEGREVYVPPFGECGLSEDETAIALLLEGMEEYVRGTGPNPYPLKEALIDSYMAICMQEALKSRKTVHSDGFLWQLD